MHSIERQKLRFPLDSQCWELQFLNPKKVHNLRKTTPRYQKADYGAVKAILKTQLLSTDLPVKSFRPDHQELFEWHYRLMFPLLRRHAAVVPNHWRTTLTPLHKKTEDASLCNTKPSRYSDLTKGKLPWCRTRHPGLLRLSLPSLLGWNKTGI